MKKSDLPLILDVAFYTTAAWFFLLGLMRYFRIPVAITLFTATLIALAVGGGVFLLLYTRHRKIRLSAAEREMREKLLLHLALETDERVRLALLNCCLSAGKEAHCEEDALSVEGLLVVPLFTMQPVSADEIARLLKRYRDTPFHLLCNALTPEAEKLLRSFGRTYTGGTEVYRFFEQNGMPDPLICGEIPRRKFRARLKDAFSKSNARPFFLSGILLLFMSLFTFFPVYYIVTGSCLLAVAVVVRALGYA